MTRAIWIVTRKHPPRVGGMERLSYEVARELALQRPVTVVRWSGTQAALPLFVTWAALRILAGLCARRISVLVLGDPVLCALGRIAEPFGVPVMVVAHGLDLTWPSPLYQSYLRRFLPGRRRAYVAISHAVSALLLARGLPAPAISVVPVGVGAPPGERAADDRLAPRPTLLYVGRLVPRKGIVWFVEAVLPRLVDRCPGLRLVVVGDGPERAALERAAAPLPHCVECVGAVTEARKWELYAACDAVVMPNRPHAGDLEGFGLVALEAGAAARVVFAADLEGLQDAVTEGRNGHRLPPGDASAWTEALVAALSDRDALREEGRRAREFVRATFDWTGVARRYAAIADALASRH